MRKEIFYGMSVLLIIIDQISKYFAERVLAYGRIDVFGSFFSLSLAHNTGAGFSILKGNNYLLVVLNVIIICSLICYYKFIDKENHLAFSLIFAGAFSNLVDRVIHGFVIDYFSIGIFPIFNVADILITIGAGLLIIDLIRNR